SACAETPLGLPSSRPPRLMRTKRPASPLFTIGVGVCLLFRRERSHVVDHVPALFLLEHLLEAWHWLIPLADFPEERSISLVRHLRIDTIARIHFEVLAF